MAADRVIVLQGSQVVDQGRPHELAARPGVFARLFEIDRPAGVDA
jgi:ABC-type multidrug transport system fused ATPase/permease subunit